MVFFNPAPTVRCMPNHTPKIRTALAAATAAALIVIAPLSAYAEEPVTPEVTPVVEIVQEPEAPVEPEVPTAPEVVEPEVLTAPEPEPEPEVAEPEDTVTPEPEVTTPPAPEVPTVPMIPLVPATPTPVPTPEHTLVTVADVYVTDQNQSVELSPAANDVDSLGESFVVTSIAATSGAGTYVLSDDGRVTFTPATDFVGTATFEYTIKSTLNPELTATGQGSILVNAVVVNTAPEIFFAAEPVTLSGQPVTLDLDVYDPDVYTSGDTFTVSSTAPSNGTIKVSGTSITYTPAEGFAGVDQFTMTATDSHGAVSAPRVATIRVAEAPRHTTDDAGTNDAPVDVDVPNELNGSQLQDVVFLSEPANGTVEYVANTPPARSAFMARTMSLKASALPAGRVVYTPNPGFVGTDSFTFVACYQSGECIAQASVISVSEAAITPPVVTPPVVTPPVVTPPSVDAPVVTRPVADIGTAAPSAELTAPVAIANPAVELNASTRALPEAASAKVAPAVMATTGSDAGTLAIFAAAAIMVGAALMSFKRRMAPAKG